MTARNLSIAFRDFARERGIVLESAPFDAGMNAMLEFYSGQRLADCEVAADGDMLLFQWGTNQWSDPPSFELDLTRQIIFSDAVDDDAIWQMHLTYRFLLTERTEALTAGDCWLANPLKTGEFSAFITGSAAYLAVLNEKPASVSFYFECAA